MCMQLCWIAGLQIKCCRVLHSCTIGSVCIENYNLKTKQSSKNWLTNYLHSVLKGEEVEESHEFSACKCFLPCPSWSWKCCKTGFEAIPTSKSYNSLDGTMYSMQKPQSTAATTTFIKVVWKICTLRKIRSGIGVGYKLCIAWGSQMCWEKA